jgi:hypothetical protein
MSNNNNRMNIKEIMIFLLGFILCGLVGSLDLNLMFLCN